MLYSEPVKSGKSSTAAFINKKRKKKKKRIMKLTRN